MKRSMSWRDVRSELRHLGAEAVRVNGSHETWRFEDGETFVAVINHLNGSVPVAILVKLRRLRERRSVRSRGEPPLLGTDGIMVVPSVASDPKGRFTMSKGSSGGGKGGGGSKGGSGGGGSKGSSGSKGGQGNGGNWPSTTGNPSGGGRGNATSSK